MSEKHQRFIISQVGLLIRGGKCLIAEFADDLAGHWGLPGGRIDVGEDETEAFKREIKEELGFDNFDNLGVVDYSTGAYKNGMTVCAIANLIRNNDQKKIALDPREHSRYKWITEEEIDNYHFLWPQTERFIKKGFEYKKLLEKNEK